MANVSRGLQERTYPKPCSLICIVGKFDWLSLPARCVDLCNVVEGLLNIVPDGNHMIDPQLVQEFWLAVC